MQPAILIRLRPRGPWRYGAAEGSNDRVDKLFRSDRLYSAVTVAMKQFGALEEWLEVTARSASAQVVFSSLFPYQGDTLFVAPPRTLWPPPADLVTSPSPVFLSKMRWDAAGFVPTGLLDVLLSGRPMLAEQWAPDPESGCLLRRDRPSNSPFRVVTRTRMAIDRVSQQSGHPDSYACVEFEANSGLWCVVRFADADAKTRWSDRVTAAFRLLADSGFGAGRSIGWGQTAQPEMQHGNWPNLLFPRVARVVPANGNGDTRSYWLLSLYSPSESDSPDWSGGSYELISRSGYNRKGTRMIAEGSVLVASKEPSGAAVNVAPEGHSHPVYRAGFALALHLPEPVEQDIQPVEEPSDVEAPEVKPCPEPPQAEPVESEPIPSVTEVEEEPAPALQPEPSEPEPVSIGSEVEEAPAREPKADEQPAPEDQRDEL